VLETVTGADACRIRFRNLPYHKVAEFAVRVDAAKGEIILVLDHDVEAAGGFHSGECLVGIEPHQTVLLIRLLQRAVTRLPETRQGPNVIGRVAFNWSDLGTQMSNDSGITLVAYSERVTLGISLGTESSSEPYLAAFDYNTGGDLAVILSRGVSSLDPSQ